MLRFYAGETIALDFTHSDYPKAEWTAEIVLRTSTTTATYEATADPDAEQFELTISATDSASIAVGEKQVIYKYTNIADTNVISIIPGPRIYFRPSPTASGDQRTQPEIDLEALDAAIRAKITNGAVESYSIDTTVGKRNLQNMSLADLRLHRRFVAGQVDKERTKAGLPRTSGNQWKKVRSNLGNQAPVPRRSNY